MTLVSSKLLSCFASFNVQNYFILIIGKNADQHSDSCQDYEHQRGLRNAPKRRWSFEENTVFKKIFLQRYIQPKIYCTTELLHRLEKKMK